MPAGESRLSIKPEYCGVLWSNQLTRLKGSCSFTCRTHRSAMTELKFAALDDAGAELNCQ